MIISLHTPEPWHKRLLAKVLRFQWTKVHTALALVLLSVQLMDVHTLFPEEQAWDVSLICDEISKALLCAALGVAAHRAAYPFVVWYLSQATDQYLNGNLFTEGLYEYACLVVLTAIAIHQLKSK